MRKRSGKIITHLIEILKRTEGKERRGRSNKNNNRDKGSYQIFR